MCQRLPLLPRPDAQQQNPHGALTAQAEAPDQIVRIAQVIRHERGVAGLDHRAGALAEVTFQASAGDEAGVLAVGRDQQHRPGLAIGRADRMHEDAERHGAASSPLALEKGEEGSEYGIHDIPIMPRTPLRALGLVSRVAPPSLWSIAIPCPIPFPGSCTSSAARVSPTPAVSAALQPSSIHCPPPESGSCSPPARASPMRCSASWRSRRDRTITIAWS